jgi:hypothetical protein
LVVYEPRPANALVTAGNWTEIPFASVMLLVTVTHFNSLSVPEVKDLVRDSALTIGAGPGECNLKAPRLNTPGPPGVTLARANLRVTVARFE